jgi:hypothetical protein
MAPSPSVGGCSWAASELDRLLVVRHREPDQGTPPPTNSRPIHSFSSPRHQDLLTSLGLGNLAVNVVAPSTSFERKGRFVPGQRRDRD